MNGTIEQLIRSQRSDGGWPDSAGPSWTETTVYGALACKAALGDVQAARRACDWLTRARRPDGGWAPSREVERSTWVTSLILLLSPDDIGREQYFGALQWVLRQTGEETGWSYRLRLLLEGGKPEAVDGWPWYPGAAAWVSPTASALLGLRRAKLFSNDAAIGMRIREGQRFLLTHACRDGGWNHGGARALGYDAPSYPETTGLALLALRGMERDKLTRALDRAKQLAATCNFPEGISWLKLGLAAHGEDNGLTFRPAKARTVRDLCLEALAERQLTGKVDL